MPPILIDTRGADDSRDVVHRAVQALAEGNIVAFPTETVYGVAVSALDEAAVARLLKIKGRDASVPLTLAIKSADDALDYVPNMNILANRLARRCWPGPVTLVLHNDSPDSLLNQLPAGARAAVIPESTVGLRVPAHPLILAVLRMLVGPLALTSANVSGQPDAVTAQEVINALGDGVDVVLDDGRSRYGQPSSVVEVHEKGFTVLRQGVVPEKTLDRLSSWLFLFVCTGNTCRSPMAEMMFRQIVAEKLGKPIETLEEQGVIVMSAGISATMGGRASRESVDVLKGRGLDLGHHESQPLTESLVRHADAIFTMTHTHRAAILAQWPGVASRTQVLCPDGMDVTDPIGGPTEVYQRCATQIHAALEQRVEEFDF